MIERKYPLALREKGKQAFYMPFLSQHRRRYYEWICSLINRESVECRGLFNWKYVQSIFEFSRKGSFLANRQLAALAMLEMWYSTFNDGKFNS